MKSEDLRWTNEVERMTKVEQSQTFLPACQAVGMVQLNPPKSSLEKGVLSRNSLNPSVKTDCNTQFDNSTFFKKGWQTHAVWLTGLPSQRHGYSSIHRIVALFSESKKYPENP
jgi:hypothetical protein